MEVVDSGTPEADDTDIATMDIQDTNSTAINDTVSVPTSDTTSDRYEFIFLRSMLTVSDDEFWEGTSPLEFGELPALQDAVTVAGYPIGGDTISVTSSVVSRTEILSYVHGSTELLARTIGALINSGSSSGPAFDDKGKCVVSHFSLLNMKMLRI
ncbi:hypothetical protein PS2_044536 [Malus domestica]